MKIMIFGKEFDVVEQKSDKDLVELKKNRIIINSCNAPPNLLLNEFLIDLLYTELSNIYEGIKKEGKIEILGDLDFEIVEKIDDKKQRIAKLKGNKVLIKLNAIILPKRALKYVIAHEIAHTLIKAHTKRFWEIVETIYPNFKTGQKLFMEYGKFL